MTDKIINTVQGYPTEDGAGVKLIRVLGNRTAAEYDPILMLDSFDSKNPKDYSAGFPMHPHRGIETISYVYRGKMEHRDSLGFSDTISDGEVQWMTAGSGILHEEMIPESERLLGVQLWLNLPAKDKMVKPEYHSIKDIEEIPFDGGKIRLLAGSYKNHKGFQGKYLPIDYYDIHIEPGKNISIDIEEGRSVMLFTLEGDAKVEDMLIRKKSAVKIGSTDTLKISNTTDGKIQVLFISTVSLKEPISWGGPIVMNTREELIEAFSELENGTFLKDRTAYEISGN